MTVDLCMAYIWQYLSYYIETWHDGWLMHGIYMPMLVLMTLNLTLTFKTFVRLVLLGGLLGGGSSFFVDRSDSIAFNATVNSVSGTQITLSSVHSSTSKLAPSPGRERFSSSITSPPTLSWNMFDRWLVLAARWSEKHSFRAALWLDLVTQTRASDCHALEVSIESKLWVAHWFLTPSQPFWLYERENTINLITGQSFHGSRHLTVFVLEQNQKMK